MRISHLYLRNRRENLAANERLNHASNLADAVDVSRVYAALAALHRRARRNDLASALEARRLELWRHWDARLPHNNFVRRQLNAANGPSVRFEALKFRSRVR